MKVFCLLLSGEEMERGISVLSLSPTQSCTSILNLEEDVSPQLPQKKWSILGVLEEKKKKCFKRAKIFSFEN